MEQLCIFEMMRLDLSNHPFPEMEFKFHQKEKKVMAMDEQN